VTCTACGKTIGSGARYCPYCGSAVQGLAAVVAGGTPSLSCPGCGSENLANARFCSDCGRQLPHAFGLAAQAAAGASQGATSSSGRQPPMTPAERDAYLARMRNDAAARAALAPPPSTGRGDLSDLAAAEEHFTRVDAAWDELDGELRAARSAAGMFPAAGDLAALADLQRRTDAAWASREAARAHRQALWDNERQAYGTPGMGLPPGDGPW
jgi:hypothetical protein